VIQTVPPVTISGVRGRVVVVVGATVVVVGVAVVVVATVATVELTRDVDEPEDRRVVGAAVVATARVVTATLSVSVVAEEGPGPPGIGAGDPDSTSGGDVTAVPTVRGRVHPRVDTVPPVVTGAGVTTGSVSVDATVVTMVLTCSVVVVGIAATGTSRRWRTSSAESTGWLRSRTSRARLWTALQANVPQATAPTSQVTTITSRRFTYALWSQRHRGFPPSGNKSSLTP
jgi:hypothetical protein